MREPGDVVVFGRPVLADQIERVLQFRQRRVFNVESLVHSKELGPISPLHCSRQYDPKPRISGRYLNLTSCQTLRTRYGIAMFIERRGRFLKSDAKILLRNEYSQPVL